MTLVALEGKELNLELNLKMSPAGIANWIKIIEAGIEVFSQEGFFAAGTLQIAAKAGVAESTIFRRFATKEDLYRECLRTALSHSLDPARFQALVFKDADEAGFSHAVLAGVKRWYAQLSVPAARLVLYTLLSKTQEWRALGCERTEKIIGILSERIDRAARGRCRTRFDPDAAATSLIATLLYLKSIRSSPRNRDPQLVETIVRQWLQGVLEK
jgi:AcrR family transcriptional regulator